MNIYDGAAIYLKGFAANIPESSDARDGDFDFVSVDPTAPALVVWFDILRPDLGDRVSVRVTGPDNAVVLEQIILKKKNQARRFMYVGKKRTVPVRPLGEYEAKITLERAYGSGSRHLRFTTTVQPTD